MIATAEASRFSTSSVPAASAMLGGRIIQHTPRPPRSAERGPGSGDPARRPDDPSTAGAAARAVPG